MLFQLETKNVETGLVYKSPLFASFAEAREEARAVSMAGRRTVRVVQVTVEPIIGLDQDGICVCCGINCYPGGCPINCHPNDLLTKGA